MGIPNNESNRELRHYGIPKDQWDPEVRRRWDTRHRSNSPTANDDVKPGYRGESSREWHTGDRMTKPGYGDQQRARDARSQELNRRSTSRFSPRSASSRVYQRAVIKKNEQENQPTPVTNRINEARTAASQNARNTRYEALRDYSRNRADRISRRSELRDINRRGFPVVTDGQRELLQRALNDYKDPKPPRNDFGKDRRWYLRYVANDPYSRMPAINRHVARQDELESRARSTAESQASTARANATTRRRVRLNNYTSGQRSADMARVEAAQTRSPRREAQGPVQTRPNPTPVPTPTPTPTPAQRTENLRPDTSTVVNQTSNNLNPRNPIINRAPTEEEQARAAYIQNELANGREVLVDSYRRRGVTYRVYMTNNGLVTRRYGG